MPRRCPGEAAGPGDRGEQRRRQADAGPAGEPPATSGIARRLDVTASAVSQRLRVLHATGLVTRARAGRQVLHRRSPLGDRLTG